MAKKLLIAGGCSYTNENYMTNDSRLPQIRGNWKMWPEWMGEKLGLKVINTAESGNGNETILHDVLEKIHMYKDRVDTVAVMWTGFDRKRIFAGYDVNPIAQAIMSLNLDPAWQDGEHPFYWLDRLGMPNIGRNFLASEDFYKVRNDFIRYSIEDSLRSMLTLAETCKMHGIKLVMMTGLFPFDYYKMEELRELGVITCPPGQSVDTTEKEVVSKFLNNPFFASIDNNYKDNFIGWPMFWRLDGTYFDNMIQTGEGEFTGKPEDYRVSDIDGHPNAKAQELISRVFLDRHGELYGK
jgi:hypothetical protein